MADLLNYVSTLSTPAIAIACAIHLVFFVILLWWGRRDLRSIASFLDDFTRGLKHRSFLDATGHLSDQIDAFIADVNEVLDQPSRVDDRRLLLERMRIIDEKRRYLNSMFFETLYHSWRTMIETYPLAGMLGTIMGIGAALQAGVESNKLLTVDLIVARFGDAIWSTFAGLVAAIVLMFLNSLIEPSFNRLAAHRGHVQAMVARAKRELSLSGEGPR